METVIQAYRHAKRKGQSSPPARRGRKPRVRSEVQVKQAVVATSPPVAVTPQRSLSPEIPLPSSDHESNAITSRSCQPTQSATAPTPQSTCAPQSDNCVTVAHIVSTLDPPQPGLLTVLENAGLRTAAALEKLGRTEYIQDEVLGSLVRENRLSRFQCALLKDAMRSLFLDN